MLTLELLLRTNLSTSQQSQSFQPDLSAFAIDSLWLKPVQATRSLLIVFAHPDDESFGNAGTILRYSNDGAAVHYACATRGECGSVDPGLLNGHKDIAALRTAELTCAAHELGLTSVHFLGHRDSGMAGSPDNAHPQSLVQAPLEQVAGQIAVLIRTIRPQVIITFGPYGGYGHPDHIKVHQATLLAISAASDPLLYPEQAAAGIAPWLTPKLYFSTFNTRMLRLGVMLMRLLRRNPERAGSNGDIDLVRALNEAGTVTTSIDSSAHLAQKERAWMCHRSQVGGMSAIRMFPTPLRKRFMGSEHFTRVRPPFRPGQPRERDLFAGIDV